MCVGGAGGDGFGASSLPQCECQQALLQHLWGEARAPRPCGRPSSAALHPHLGVQLKPRILVFVWVTVKSLTRGKEHWLCRGGRPRVPRGCPFCAAFWHLCRWGCSIVAGSWVSGWVEQTVPCLPHRLGLSPSELAMTGPAVGWGGVRVDFLWHLLPSEACSFLPGGDPCPPSVPGPVPRHPWKRQAGVPSLNPHLVAQLAM